MPSIAHCVERLQIAGISFVRTRPRHVAAYAGHSKANFSGSRVLPGELGESFHAACFAEIQRERCACPRSARREAW